MRLITFISALLILFPVRLNAQLEQLPRDGSQLRLKISGKSGTYLLDRIDADTLYVSGAKDGRLMPIPFGRVERAEIKVPRSRGWGALRGAFAGAAIGGTIGMIIGAAKWGEPDSECGAFQELCDDTFGFLQMMGYITVIGGPAMVLGGIVGAAHPGERWERFDLPRGVSLGLDRDRSFVVQYRRSF